MKQRGLVKLYLVAGLALAFQGRMYAEQFSLTGARAAGMGGANAASVRDATAQWHNPAAFGFFSSSQWTNSAADNNDLSGQGFSCELIGIGAGYTLTDDMGRYLDILADIDFDTFDAGSLSSDSQHVSDLLSVAGLVGSLDSRDALYADAAVGTSLQIGHFGVGVRMFGEAGAWTVPDTDNLALDDYASIGDLVTEIDNAAANESFVWDGSYALTPQQRSDLAAALGGIDPNGGTIQYLDDKFDSLSASGDLTSGEIAEAIDLFGSLVPGVGGSIDTNLTTVVGRGFSLVEIPVSYGWALNENLSIGATAKLMHGTVLGTKVWIFNNDNDQVLEDITDHTESSMNVGLDLGVLYRIPKFQFAAVGHNLNRPTFSGFNQSIDLTLNGGVTESTTVRVPDVKIDPQLTVGAAYMPTRRLTLEGNLDLLEMGTVLPGYDIQRLSLGGEVDVWVLALRLGAYRNLAASWQDWVATAGVGVTLAGVKVDVGGAYSLGSDVEYDGNDIPSEARLYGSIGLDF